MNNTSVVEKTLLILDDLTNKYVENSQVKAFQEASASFDKLIEQGVIKYRQSTFAQTTI